MQLMNVANKSKKTRACAAYDRGLSHTLVNELVAKVQSIGLDTGSLKNNWIPDDPGPQFITSTHKTLT